VPQGQHRIAGRDIRLGNGSLSVRARRLGGQLRTTVDVGLRGVRVTVGYVLPPGARVARVRPDGQLLKASVQRTSRGREVTVRTGDGVHRLVVTLR
jgi:hypothetical protein